MKKLLFILASSLIVLCSVQSISFADGADKTTTEPSKTSKAIEATKEATDKAVKATKKATNKAVKATKKATKKSVKATKDFTNKTVENTKDAFENMNPNKPVTREDLEGKAKIKTLKNERKELKAAFNSRIKDIDAKVKLAEKSTTMSDAQRQNKVYTLNREKADLILQRDSALKKYDARINEAKEQLKKES